MHVYVYAYVHMRGCDTEGVGRCLHIKCTCVSCVCVCTRGVINACELY